VTEPDHLPSPRMPGIGHRNIAKRCNTVGVLSSSSYTIRAAATPRSDIFHRWTLSGGVRRQQLIPTHISLPSCSWPSRTSPPGAPKRGPSLTAAARDGRTIVRAGTEECLRRRPNQRMARHRRATCRQIRSPNPSAQHSTKPGSTRPQSVSRKPLINRSKSGCLPSHREHKPGNTIILRYAPVTQSVLYRYEELTRVYLCKGAITL
jgi:hypothetical protein